MYLALLGSTQAFDKDRLAKAEMNVGAMIALHEDILKGLKAITQDCIASARGRRSLPRLAKHVRFGSVESLRSTSQRRMRSKFHGSEENFKENSRLAEPKEAAEVAVLFGKMLRGASKPQTGKFFVYEEYGAMYAEMLQTCAAASRTIADWDVFERGMEALVHHVLQPYATPKGDKKGLTLEDLLIKVRYVKIPRIHFPAESWIPLAPPADLPISSVVCRA